MRSGGWFPPNWYRRSKGKVSGWLEAAQVLLKGGRKWWAGWQVGKKLSTRIVPQLDASGSGLSRQTLN